jgi:hypothetical protein
MHGQQNIKFICACVLSECSGILVTTSKVDESWAGIAQSQKASVTDISVMYSA